MLQVVLEAHNTLAFVQIRRPFSSALIYLFEGKLHT